jgi:host factor-I protein
MLMLFRVLCDSCGKQNGADILVIADGPFYATIRGMSFRTAAPTFSKKTTKTPPPDDTGMESSYLKALGEKQTPVSVKLVCGETLHGWIEYYDVNMVRLTREGSPNLFIFKHEIMYIAEDTGRRAR